MKILKESFKESDSDWYEYASDSKVHAVPGGVVRLENSDLHRGWYVRYESNNGSVEKERNFFEDEETAKEYADNLVKYYTESVKEDTVKTKSGKWVNKGKEGTHGEFDTKKQADAQRRAMYANGYHESQKLIEDEDSEFQVGDRVKCIDGNRGEIVEITNDTAFVRLDDGNKASGTSTYFLSELELDI